MFRYLKIQSFERLYDLSFKSSFKHVKRYPRTIYFQSHFNLSTSAEPVSDPLTFIVENEQDVGATEFLSDHKGFSGILRHLYTDFLVNEISRSKEMVRLSNLGFCEKTVSNFFKLIRLLPKSQTNVLMEVFEGKITKETEVNVSTVQEENIDDLCETLRKLVFNLEVYRKTTDFGKVIVLNTHQERMRTYTNFILYKENHASIDSVEIIANLLKVRKRDVSVAGMKDKRAVSCQRVTLRNVRAEKLLELNKRLIGMKIGDVYYDTRPLKLGRLYGNHFTIVIRNIDEADSVVNLAMENFKEKGFINYFGMQRFGRTNLPIFAVGQKLIARDWKGAVETIMKPNNIKMKEDILKCRQVWWETRDSKLAFSYLQYKYNRIGYLLKGLIENDDNYEKALNWLPHDILQLYLHSYCSYLWNNMVSRRLRELGTSPVLGDLIVPSDIVTLREFQIDQLRVVDQDILQSKDLSMYNVVLPLPGCNIKLPENQVADWCSELLAKDNLNLTSFESENPRLNVQAAYRHILRKPENVSWSIVNYNEPDEPILLTDYQILQGLRKEDSVGARRAVKMQFTLPASTYATSALGEITRCPATKLMNLD